MTRFIDIIPVFTRSISFKHTNYLLYCTKLEEVYDDLSFTKEEVISSLQSIDDTLEDFNEEDLLDRLNEEFLNVGVMFFEYDNQFGSVKASYPKEGIVAAEYISEKRMIYVYINDSFFFNFMNKKYDLLANAIVAVCTHEDTHKQQLDHSKEKVKGLDLNTDIHTKKGFEAYLSNPIDIDAHARETAIYLYNSGYSGAKINEILNNHDPILLDCSAYKKYWDHFGIMKLYTGTKDKDTINRLKIWKRFLSRIVAYLITTLRYRFTVKYEEALKRLNEIEQALINS